MNLSNDLKKRLDDHFGGNWNVVIGEAFVTALGLLPVDRFGHFKVDGMNLLVFETSSQQ